MKKPPTRDVATSDLAWWINIGHFPGSIRGGPTCSAALTLKGLTYSPTGALLAASTTSLPETPQRGRSQLGLPLRLGARLDARTVGPLYTLGLDREADDCSRSSPACPAPTTASAIRCR